MFKDTHARVGLIPSWGLSAMLPQAVGVRRARQMTLTGDPVDPRRALEWGLVNEVVPHAQFVAPRRWRSRLRHKGSRTTCGVLRSRCTRAARVPHSPNSLGLEAETHALWKLNNETARARFEDLVGRDGQPTSAPA